MTINSRAVSVLRKHVRSLGVVDRTRSLRSGSVSGVTIDSGESPVVAILSRTRQVAGSSPAGGAAIIAGQGDFSDSASKPVPSACYLRLSRHCHAVVVPLPANPKWTRHDNHRTPSHPAYRLRAWCEYGDRHPDALFRGDQSCWGPRSYVESWIASSSTVFGELVRTTAGKWITGRRVRSDVPSILC
jgi:hypothetical protein